MEMSDGEYQMKGSKNAQKLHQLGYTNGYVNILYLSNITTTLKSEKFIVYKDMKDHHWSLLDKSEMIK